jgi:hypothetical protein
MPLLVNPFKEKPQKPKKKKKKRKKSKRCPCSHVPI